eukprot:scaffold85879_cov68-Attheya_sp.AAC.1
MYTVSSTTRKAVGLTDGFVTSDMHYMDLDTGVVKLDEPEMPLSLLIPTPTLELIRLTSATSSLLVCCPFLQQEADIFVGIDPIRDDICHTRGCTILVSSGHPRVGWAAGAVEECLVSREPVNDEPLGMCLCGGMHMHVASSCEGALGCWVMHVFVSMEVFLPCSCGKKVRLYVQSSFVDQVSLGVLISFDMEGGNDCVHFMQGVHDLHLNAIVRFEKSRSLEECAVFISNDPSEVSVSVCVPTHLVKYASAIRCGDNLFVTEAEHFVKVIPRTIEELDVDFKNNKLLSSYDFFDGFRYLQKLSSLKLNYSNCGLADDDVSGLVAEIHSINRLQELVLDFFSNYEMYLSCGIENVIASNPKLRSLEINFRSTRITDLTAIINLVNTLERLEVFKLDVGFNGQITEIGWDANSTTPLASCLCKLTISFQYSDQLMEASINRFFKTLRHYSKLDELRLTFQEST